MSARAVAFSPSGMNVRAEAGTGHGDRQAVELLVRRRRRHLELDRESRCTTDRVSIVAQRPVADEVGLGQRLESAPRANDNAGPVHGHADVLVGRSSRAWPA